MYYLFVKREREEEINAQEQQLQYIQCVILVHFDRQGKGYILYYNNDEKSKTRD